MIAKENLEDLIRRKLITIGYSFGIGDVKNFTFDDEQIVNPDDAISVGYHLPCVQLKNHLDELTEAVCCRFAYLRRRRPYDSLFF